MTYLAKDYEKLEDRLRRDSMRGLANSFLWMLLLLDIADQTEIAKLISAWTRRWLTLKP